ncbi:alpha/beta hydrolase [Nocardioides sp. YIM 152315]|uniref:alpha/beta hydrolase n=1 Tax=Nocardioides sp. YIM 152315 TaxID=3031760 RepID=UPI0023DB5D54|nr:alpha/beta hydrolase [Nocardioides sp. YIM 152315]MDF1606217.1 alpha/beta hydrolase [Nocardioides sp. YIM 152315]
MPSRRHQFLAWAIPRMRGAGEIASPEAEKARLEAWHRTLEPRLPTQAVRGFEKRFSVVTESVPGGRGTFASYVVTPRHSDPRTTVVYLHGGGYVAGLDPFHVRYLTRLADALDARVVLPDYPVAPEHTWRDSHHALADLTARWATDSERLVLAGDSAGGGYALALALTLRDRGGPQPDRLLLIAPWVDLTTSTPETHEFSVRDPWLFLSKLESYAGWWAGSPDDLARPEVSPALGELAGLPPTLMFCGTRDTLAPGCRLLEGRAAEAGWDLAYVEVADLVHVYPLLPWIPEAGDALARTLEFLR